jgi:preprotein translocase subunit SecA
MIKSMLKKVLGSQHDREVKRLQPVVARINEIAGSLSSLSEEELKGKTEEFRTLISDRTGDIQREIDELRETKARTEDSSDRERMAQEIGVLERKLLDTLDETLDEILPEAFAVVKEACRRLMGTEIVVTGSRMTWEMIPYDVQLIGGIALHEGKVAEMATGEGKTLVATLPMYLNALAGRGAHLVTVNPYLAQRDAEWMATVYGYLGLTVDILDLHQPGTPERRAAYEADITYGTNNEFGFDYLRDNMVPHMDARVQRGHHYAIIDEVDSILIDEARTPLIISGPVGRDTSTPFRQYAPLVGSLHRKQSRICNDLVAAAEAALENEDEWEAGTNLLAVRRGAPKHKKLLKLFADDPGLQRLVQKVEADYMREKRLHEVDELLLFAMDEKGHNVGLSDKGIEELSPGDPDAFVVPDISEMVGEIQMDETLSVDQRREKAEELEKTYADKSQRMHVIHQLLKAYTLFQKDEQYIIGEDGSIVIVDEFTGRQMAGRRWSDGLHQAVEAKEGVEIRGETQTLATITIQNYFRMYDKLSGMTGTAETEENEFHQIYDLDVMVIPTNRPVVREDREDLIFRTKREKFNAMIEEIQRLNKMEMPVLVGTTNVEVSETFSRMLKRRGIKHNVLNAKHHAREAEIVAEAGQPGAVTIATNMAGRGTDIKLGEGVKEARAIGWARARGLDLEELHSLDPILWKELEKQDDDFVIESGGLQILGSERHESRRIDRQLRGRSGRQGDPGRSQFFLSLEDDLMRLFMSDRVAGAMEKLGAQEGEVITHSLVTNSIGRAQKRVEGNNFEARKRLLDYDDVMNQQREVIYDLRLFALEGGADLRGEMWEMIEHTMDAVAEEYCPSIEEPEAWDVAGLRRRLMLDYLLVIKDLPEQNPTEEEDPPFEEKGEILELVLSTARDAFHRKLESFGDQAERVASFIMLQVIDDKWKDHLYDLDHLKASISFRGWGQKDPLIEYKREAYEMFVDLMTDLRKTLTGMVFRAQLSQPRMTQPRPQQRLMYSGPSEAQTAQGAAAAAGAPRGRLRRPEPGGLDTTGIASGARADDGAAPQPAGVGARRSLASPVAGMGPATDVARLATNRGEDGPKAAPVTAGDTVGRNDPCPCGSGKKYKKCHGRGA